MEIEELLKYIEDRDVQVSDEWFFHATKADIGTVKSILNEGIKAACFRGKNGNNFNGKYYISLFKKTVGEQRLFGCFLQNPKFIINGIHPYYADRQKLRTRRLFIKTRIPLRTSEWDGEYQQYLEIQPDKFVGLEYSLSYLLLNEDDSYKKIGDRLKFLKEMILCMEEENMDLPLYDLSSDCEINKERVLSLHL